uniref:Uncharacterized protein n=1 Tax=Anguilla anguilla TaxID=7936 RepID=A0A0E9S4Q0_ANGAN
MCNIKCTPQVHKPTKKGLFLNILCLY